MLKIEVITNACAEGEAYHHTVAVSEDVDQDNVRSILYAITDSIQTLYAAEGVRSILIEVE